MDDNQDLFQDLMMDISLDQAVCFGVRTAEGGLGQRGALNEEKGGRMKAARVIGDLHNQENY